MMCSAALIRTTLILGLLHSVLGFIYTSQGEKSDYEHDAGGTKKKLHLAILTDISSDMYSTTGYENLAAAKLAIEDINADKTFLDDYTLTYTFRDDGCQRRVGLQALSNVYSTEDRVDAVIGISCSVVCELAGYLCDKDQWNIPVISHSCSSGDLSDLETFPTFARLSLSVLKYVPAIISTCKEFGWDRVGIMVRNIDWYVNVAVKMQNNLENNPVYKIDQVFMEKFYNQGKSDKDTVMYLEEQLQRIKEKIRVIVIVGYADDISLVLKHASKIGMGNGHFAFMTQEFIQADLDKEDRELMSSIQGVLDFEPLLIKTDPGYQSFSHRVREVVKENEYPKTGKDANLVAAQMYDAVYLYAKSVEKAIAEGVSLEDGSTLVKLMSGISWTGKSGAIDIDEVGDRQGNIQVMNIQEGEFIQVGTWWMNTQAITFNKDADNESYIIWPGEPTSPPVACGRQWELCQTFSDAMARITLLTLVCVALLSGVLVRLYLYNRLNRT